MGAVLSTISEAPVSPRSPPAATGRESTASARRPSPGVSSIGLSVETGHNLGQGYLRLEAAKADPRK